ncbi:hypothetical protein BOTBODRAFT_26122 [Botryobasidium botryosum FD-172 SS1]|uniref:4-aminobutyrate aminotransferase n=1 Tax=Botryobasidium botryosum (strain FD-172 SS1) TaxID=930990 RepID=A0A067N3Y7_BOTB1|nr:hypothetical protein BOTBODRAFT_26122 [Botryobasidium botryosum FD-172 SS1]
MTRLLRSIAQHSTNATRARLLTPLSARAFTTSSSSSSSSSSPSTASELTDFGVRHVGKGVSRLTNGVMASAKGSYVTFEDGRKMLDFTTGIGVTGLGHCHPKVSQAAADQCLTLVHGQCSVAFSTPYLRLIERLMPVMPDPSLDTFMFLNSGSEATEAALKLARHATGRQNVIVMQGGYHGRTYGAVAMSKSKTIYSEGFLPLMPGVFSTAFPYWHQLGLPPNASEEVLVQQSLIQLEHLLQQQTAPTDTAAIIVEPVLGEGGYVPAPKAFLEGLRAVCDKHGIILIFDEVQSGFGRTGKYFSCEYSGVRPDVMVMAKGLANGFPLSGIVSRKELMDKQKPGTMGGTYCGNPVALAAARACADVMAEEKILENVNARSKELFTFLDKLRQDPKYSSVIVDVRGRGLMVAAEFAAPTYPAHDPAANASAPKGIAARLTARCVDKGLLLLATSIFQTVRFIPPLNISQEDLAKGMKIFEEALAEVVHEG